MGKNIHKGIVIVNEFTINGSRGHSPGNYVLEYMARDNASENMTPTIPRREYIEKLSEDMLKRHKKKIDNQTGKGEPNPSDYVTRYMARESATEKLSLDGAIRISELEEEFDELQGMSGVAFSRDNISLSHNDVKKMSKMIQSEYEKKKPVFKTVISFDTEYLKEMGVLPEDVEIKKRGDLYGKADQAKLRLAIQHGLKNIKSEFSDLDYIGVIQVDTMHLHCHLAMVDKGPGKRFTKKGEQKGMLSTNMMTAIRRGIDNSLDQQSLIKPLSIQMDSEKRNTIGFIKRFAYKVMEERGTLQYLLACLPKDDKSLWKASVNTDGGKDGVMEIQKKGNKKKYVKGNMKKANEILRSHVIDLINRPDSGFREALQVEHDYLITRKNRGDFNNYQMYKTRTINDKKKSVLVRLTPDEAVREEEEKFKETIITNGMNAVYDILKNVDDKTVILHTPLLDAMSMPYEEMANHVKDNKLIEFGFKLRSYGSRLEYHKDSYHKVNQVIHQYEDGDQTTYNPESKALYDFLKVERDYNHAVMCKYQTFLHFYHSQTEYVEQYEDVQFLRTRSNSSFGTP